MRTIELIVDTWGADYLKLEPSVVERMGFAIPTDPFSVAVKLNIDDVAELFLRSKAEDWSTRDFPCPLPPWPLTYSEWRAPDDSFPRLRATAHLPVGLRAACFAFARELDPGEVGSSASAKWLVTFVQFRFSDEAARDVVSVVLDEQGDVNEHPELTAIPFFRARRESGERGGKPPKNLRNLLAEREPEVLDAIGPELARDDALKAELMINWGFGFVPFLMALSFCNCRNVRLVESKVSAKRQRRDRNQGRPVLERFYTLEIRGIGESIQHAMLGQAQGSLKRALHICMGHFKKYGIEGRKPLFGEHAGRFYFPSHLRGAASSGVVHKDYKVKP
jgi:hypothetical protein